MEIKNAENTEVKDKWYKSAPSWFQMLWTIGGFLIAVGVTYADVQNNTREIGNVKINQIEVAKMTVEIRNLHDQLEDSNRTQQVTNAAVLDLSKSVNELSNAVSRLQGRIEDGPIKKSRP